MSGTKVFLDTNIVLYLLNGDKTVADLIDGKQVYLSFITQLELLGFPGITQSQRKGVNAFISSCTVIDINNEIKAEVIGLKQKYRIKLPDAIIIASAIFIGVPLISADKQLLQAQTELEIIAYSQ